MHVSWRPAVRTAQEPLG